MLEKTVLQAKLGFRAELIQDKNLKAMVIELLRTAPDYFWTKPSSSSGKYHPADELGEGGLALHTLRVVEIARVMMDSNPKLFELKDEIIAACILHDIRRYGDPEHPSEHSVNEHPDLVADVIEKWATQKEDFAISRVAGCVRAHMGRWGKVPCVTQAAWCVHLADNIASKIDNIRSV